MDLEHSPTKLLGHLLAIDTSCDHGWGHDELLIAWRHALNRPICAVWLPPRTHRGGGSTAATLVLGEILHACQPRMLEEVRAVKDWAKSCMADSASGEGSDVPPQIASVAYHAMILLARRWHGQRISSIGEDELREAIDWAQRQPWLDNQTRTRLEAAMGHQPEG